MIQLELDNGISYWDFLIEVHVDSVFDRITLHDNRFMGETKDPENVVYLSFHGRKTEAYVQTTRKKAKKLLAFVQREMLWQPWNRRNPKICKLLNKSHMDAESRFMGACCNEETIMRYLKDLGIQMKVLESNRSNAKEENLHEVLV